MRFFFFLFVFFLLSVVSGNEFFADEDNDFAEFEVSDDSFIDSGGDSIAGSVDETVASSTSRPQDNAGSDDDNDFAMDGDDFEGDEIPISDDSDSASAPPKLEIKPLTFADIPTHFRSNWSSYQVEAGAIFVIILYMLNYLVGKQLNQSIAQKWFNENLPLLTNQFALVGDDGVSEKPGGTLIRETDYSFTLWCSGRVGVQSLFSQLRLIKRQDLIGVVMHWIKPREDKVTHRVDFEKKEIDSIVLVFGSKKSVAKAAKEYADLATYAAERKGVDRFGLSSNFAVWSEVSESMHALLDTYVVQTLNEYEKYIDLVHISDQFSGYKLQEGETYTRMPETTQSVFFTFNIENGANSAEITTKLNKFMFYLIEKLRRYRLSREAKVKTDKKRQSVEESFLKITHQQRQEEAQARREEKQRERKQRIMEEEDPEKQRRLQKQEEKRESRAKHPKMKQLRLK